MSKKSHPVNKTGPADDLVQTPKLSVEMGLLPPADADSIFVDDVPDFEPELMQAAAVLEVPLVVTMDHNGKRSDGK